LVVVGRREREREGERKREREKRQGGWMARRVVKKRQGK
jgi:hypothetical protein